MRNKYLFNGGNRAVDLLIVENVVLFLTNFKNIDCLQKVHNCVIPECTKNNNEEEFITPIIQLLHSFTFLFQYMFYIIQPIAGDKRFLTAILKTLLNNRRIILGS